jgi:hypothetical protein
MRTHFDSDEEILARILHYCVIMLVGIIIARLLNLSILSTAALLPTLYFLATTITPRLWLVFGEREGLIKNMNKFPRI